MEQLNAINLEEASYRELQALAKQHGIRANAKRDQLLAELSALLSTTVTDLPATEEARAPEPDELSGALKRLTIQEPCLKTPGKETKTPKKTPRRATPWNYRMAESRDEVDYDASDDESALEEEEREEAAAPFDTKMAAAAALTANDERHVQPASPAVLATASPAAAIATTDLLTAASTMPSPEADLTEGVSVTSPMHLAAPEASDAARAAALEFEQPDQPKSEASVTEKEEAVVNDGSGGGGGSNASVRLQQLVADKWYLSFVPTMAVDGAGGGRVRCALTGHEVPPSYDAVVGHLGGKHMKRFLLEGPLTPQQILALAPEQIVPAAEGSRELVCLLTGRTLRATQKAVTAHLASKERSAAVSAAAAAAALKRANKENKRRHNVKSAYESVTKPSAGKSSASASSAKGTMAGNTLAPLKGLPAPCGSRVVFSEHENEVQPLRATEIWGRK